MRDEQLLLIIKDILDIERQNMISDEKKPFANMVVKFGKIVEKAVSENENS